MAKFTLFELHLDGAEFTANAPGVDALRSTEEGTEAEEPTEDQSGRRGPLLAVLVLLLAATAAVAAKRLLGTSADEEEPLEDL